MLIVDLDDTIFKTSSMNPKIFDSAIEVIVNYYIKSEKRVLKEIVNALWEKPIDVVFHSYGTPTEIQKEFYAEISQIEYSELKIEPFADYTVLKEIDMDQVLVTTGLLELQNAKINALGIRDDFKQVLIDDPRTKPRIDKYQLFRQILGSSKLKANEIWVIGDNPDSEIKAASKLGINTIQRRSESKMKSDLADYYIESFNELPKLLNLGLETHR
ncbi:MAG: HAD family hydrolase [Bacteroidota bacterium]